MKVNALGLVGAAIGAVAIFLSWLRPWWFGETSVDLIDAVNEAPAYHIAWYSAVFFIIGTLVALVSPTGGFLQFAGVLTWWNFVLRAINEMPSRVGSYLGLASAVIVLASIMRPFGPGLISGPFSLKSRLLIFTVGHSP